MFTRIARIMSTALVAAAATLTLAGCPGGEEPIVGEWEGAEELYGERNTLEIDDRLEGEARIFFTLDGGFYYLDFEVTAETDGDEYALEMECDGNCADFDFEMICEVDGDEMECEGDGIWSDYTFEWRLE